MPPLLLLQSSLLPPAGSWLGLPDSGIPLLPSESPGLPVLLLATGFSCHHQARPSFCPPTFFSPSQNFPYLVALQQPHSPAAWSAQSSPPPRTDGDEDIPFTPKGCWSSWLPPPPPATCRAWLSASPLCFPSSPWRQQLLQTLLVNPAWQASTALESLPGS